MLLTCDYCGKEFHRKPSHFHRNTSVHTFCSQQCAYASPLRGDHHRKMMYESRLDNLPVVKLSQFNLGYVSGIIDGEGSFNITPGSRSMNVSLVVAMCNKPIIVYLKEITGVGSISKAPHNTTRNNPLWRWGVYSKVDLSVLVPLLIPALIDKRKQAEYILEFCNRRVSGIEYSEYDSNLDALIKSENHRRYEA